MSARPGAVAPDFELTATGAELVAISTDEVASHERFVAAEDLPFRLLADVSGAAARTWGVAGSLGRCRRASFVVDAEGLVHSARVSRTGATFRSGEQLVADVRAAAQRRRS